MKNALEKHGLRGSLSPSSVLTWAANPGLWVGKYLLQMRDDAGPKAWVGGAVEAGLNAWLYRRNEAEALAYAQAEWMNKSMGDVSDDAEAAAGRIPAMLTQAITAAEEAGLPTPVSFQARIECWLDGLPVSITGYTDWQWADEIVDLKTTAAMPSKPRNDHVIQVAIYRRATNKRGRLLYVTEKKRAIYDVSDADMDAVLPRFVTNANTLLRFLDRVKDGRDALSLLPTNESDYRMNDALAAMMADARRAA